MTGTISREQASETGTRGVQRADIQGLRAIAVMLVVIFHLWPTVLPGGYIGVDVFFVISGFLITSQLLREVDRSGTVSLPTFWARRARRLLPAAFTVLVVVTALIWLVAPAGLTGRFLTEVIASAGYVENLVLAGSSVDYLAAEQAPSPIQQFWSLAVEEQFYLVWPLLIVSCVAGSARLDRRRTPRRPRRAIALGLGLVVVASFAWSVLVTARDPAPSYFLPTTRAWEFGAGGLLALAAPGLPALHTGWRRWRVAAAWLGLGAIAVAGLSFGPATPFPGWAAAIPVLGSVAVIAAAQPPGRWSPVRLCVPRPVQRLGDLSYGIYLWHWPLIVLVPRGLARPLSLTDALIIVAATIALAAATERWIEKPVRSGSFAVRPPRATFAAVVALMAVVVMIPLSTLGAAHERLRAEQQRIETLVDTANGCLGAAALERTDCRSAESAVAMILDPSLADASPERCISGIRSFELTVCRYGVEEGVGARNIALIGDSHAEQWLPALADAARERNWTLFVLAKSSCPFGPDKRFEKHMASEELQVMNESCADWNDDVLEWIVRHPDVDTIVTAARARNPVVADEGEDWRETAMSEYRERWSDLPGTVTSIRVLRDTPRMADDYLSCLAGSGDDAASRCAVPLSAALDRDAAAEAAAESSDPRVGVLDLTRYFCPDGLCRPVIGGVLAYRDSHHVSWVYARTLAPFMGREIAAFTPSPA